MFHQGGLRTHSHTDFRQLADCTSTILIQYAFSLYIIIELTKQTLRVRHIQLTVLSDEALCCTTSVRERFLLLIVI